MVIERGGGERPELVFETPLGDVDVVGEEGPARPSVARAPTGPGRGRRLGLAFALPASAMGRV